MSPIVTMQRPRCGPAAAAAPQEGETVSATVYRWDGNTGSVKVSAGFPLKVGAVYASDLTKIVVRDETDAEVAIAVQELRGRFVENADYALCSLRSVGIQFVVTLTNDTPKAYTVEIGGATRTIANDLAWVEPVYNSSGTYNGTPDPTVPCALNRAVIFPNDSQYLCDTFVALTPLQPEADDVAGDAATWFQSDSGTTFTMGKYASDFIANGNSGFGALATYEIETGLLAGYIRANSDTKRRQYYKWAYDTLVAQIVDPYQRIGSAIAAYASVWGGADASLPPASTTTKEGDYNEQHSGYRLGYASGYLLTAWKQPWRRLCYDCSKEMTAFTSQVNMRNMVHSTYQVRFNMQVRMLTLLASYVVDATMRVSGGYGSGRYNDTHTYPDQLPWTLDALEYYIYTSYRAELDGLVGLRQTSTDGGYITDPPYYRVAGEFPLFQLMIASKVLIFYYQNIKNDSRCVTWVQRMADILIGYLYLETGESLNMWSLQYWAGDLDIGPSRGANFQPPCLTEVFGFVYAHTADTTYKTWAERCANRYQFTDSLNPGGYFTADVVKSFGEFWSGGQQSTVAYLNGVSTRPVSGAHPTTIVAKPTYTS